MVYELDPSQALSASVKQSFPLTKLAGSTADAMALPAQLPGISTHGICLFLGNDFPDSQSQGRAGQVGEEPHVGGTASVMPLFVPFAGCGLNLGPFRQ